MEIMAMPAARIASLAEADPEDHPFYQPHPDGGFFFPAELLEIARKHIEWQTEAEAKLAEMEQEITRERRLLADMLITEEIERLMRAAGVDPGLLGGAVALFRQRTPTLTVGDDPNDRRVRDEHGAGLVELVDGFLAGDSGRVFLTGYRQRQAIVGRFTRELRELTADGKAH